MQKELILTKADSLNYRALCNFIHGRRVRKTSSRRGYDAISAAMRLRLLNDQDYCCDHCGKAFHYDGRDATADHIIQFSYGGEANYNNIRLVHQECNIERAKNYGIDLIVRHYGPIDYDMIEYIPVVKF